jgi:hypothetical protein
MIMKMRDRMEGFPMWCRLAGLTLLCMMALVMTISATMAAPSEPNQESLRRIKESLQALYQSMSELKGRLPDEPSPQMAPLTKAVRAGLENCLRANSSQVENLIDYLHTGIDSMRSRQIY